MNPVTRLALIVLMFTATAACVGQNEHAMAQQSEAVVATAACDAHVDQSRKYRNPFLRARRIGGTPDTDKTGGSSCLTRQ
jgi:hypothetical protein